MTAVFRAVVRVLADDGGVTLAEYALVLAVLSIGTLTALAAVATRSSVTLGGQADRFTTLQTGP